MRMCFAGVGRSAFGVSGGYQNASDNDDKRTYYRVLRNIDLTDDAQETRILSMLGKSVFNHLAMRVTLDKAPEEGTCAA